LKVVPLKDILAVLDPDAAMAAVADAFRRHAAGQAQVGAVSHLGFTDPPGDCHIKAAHLHGDDVFVAKLALGFYRNPEIGWPPSNGFMAVISATTGEVLALLHDEGQLTDHRTAMAGAVAAKAIARPDSKVLGIVGSGVQAGLQAHYITGSLGLQKVVIWSRSAKRAEALAATLRGEGLDASMVDSAEALAAQADLIVTTTPATSPVLTDAMIRPGTRVVAVGADAPGKQELDAAILGRAKRVIVDARNQCVDHGETGWAVRSGLVREDDLIQLGALLSDPSLGDFAPEDIVVADLTGVAVQDVAIAKSVWERLQK
jgi:ornithine cyclodeaminase